MSKNPLRERIDEMVEEAIRRILPEVMNEVLLRTVARAGVVQEAAPARRPEPTRQAPAPKRQAPKVSSLREMLDEGAGAEFYSPPSPPPRPSVVEQRISRMPEPLQMLAEDIDLHDHEGDGGSWDDEEMVPGSSDVGPPIDLMARKAGVDFSQARRFNEAMNRPRAQVDPSAKAAFEETRLKALRERLNGGKPVA